MSVACFDGIEGILEFANPFRALTPRGGSRTPRGARTPRTPSKAESKAEGAGADEGESPVVVPPTLVCRAKGDGVPLGLLCRVSRRGDLLMLGCHRTGKLTGVRMLKNANVEVPSPGVIEINARSAPSLMLRLDTAQEAEFWAADFRGCPSQPPTPRGASRPPASVLSTPRVEKPNGRQGDVVGLSPWTAGGGLDAPSCVLASSGRNRSKETASTCSGVATAQSTRASTRCVTRRTTKEKQSTSNSEEDMSSDLEGWVEAQTARSSRLMQLFEKEHRRMEETADELASRQRLIETESRCIDLLEVEQMEHQEGLDKLQQVVAQLSNRCRKADDGPQYFFIGDSEVPEVEKPSPSPSTEWLGAPAQSKNSPLVPQLKLSSCRSSIEKTVQRADDAWEDRRRVLQKEAEMRAARRTDISAEQAIRKAPLMSPRRLAGRRRGSGGSQSLREAHGMMIRQLSAQNEQAEESPRQTSCEAMALPGEAFDLYQESPSASRQSTEPVQEAPIQLADELEEASPAVPQQEEAPLSDEAEIAVSSQEEVAAPTEVAEEASEGVAPAQREEPGEASEGVAPAQREEPGEEKEDSPDPTVGPVLLEAAQAEGADAATCEHDERFSSRPESSDGGGSWSRMVSEEDDLELQCLGAPNVLLSDGSSGSLKPASIARRSFEEDAESKASEIRKAWVPNKHFPKPGEGGETAETPDIQDGLLMEPPSGPTDPSHVAWVIPEPLPEDPVEDSELQVALERRRQQVESAHCEFTKEGIHSPADVPRDSPRPNKFRTSSK